MVALHNTGGKEDCLSPAPPIKASAPTRCRGVAQLVEHRSPKPRATGSNPVTPAISFNYRYGAREVARKGRPFWAGKGGKFAFARSALLNLRSFGQADGKLDILTVFSEY